MTTSRVAIVRPASILLSQGLVLGTALRANLKPPRIVPRARGAHPDARMSEDPNRGAAVFTIGGEPDQSVSISIPERIDLLRDDGPGALAVATWAALEAAGEHPPPASRRHDPPDSLNPTLLKLDGEGYLSFRVGSLVADVAPALNGAWRGELTVTAQYN